MFLHKDHCLLTPSCLVNLIDANSKLVEVVTVADVDDMDRVGNSQQFVAHLEAEVFLSLFLTFFACLIM